MDHQEYLGALECAWEPECLLPSPQMLGPQRHSEHVHLVNSKEKLESNVDNENSPLYGLCYKNEDVKLHLPIWVVAAELGLPTANLLEKDFYEGASE